jgi:DHA1 family multidrug resistance protein-like MFS transporter
VQRGGWGRLTRASWTRTLAVLWFAQIVAELAFSFALPFIPLYINQDLGVADPAQAALWAGVMGGGFALVMAVLGPVWGMVADRFGRRLMIQRALFGAALVIGAMAFVQTPEQLLVLRLLQGAVTGVVVATSTVVSLTTPRHRLAMALGMMQAAMFLGQSIGPVVGGIVSDRYGFRTAFVATGLLFLISGVLVTLLVAEPPRQPGERAQARLPLLASLRQFTGRPDLMAVIGLLTIIRFASTAAQPVLPLYIQQLAPDEANVATATGLVVAASAVAATISALFLGQAADRYGRRRLLLVCLLAAAVLSLPQALVTSVPQLLVLRTAQGFALGGMLPAVQALFTDLTPAGQRGMAFGVLATASAVGNGAGPITGSLIAVLVSVPMALAAMGPVYLAGAWLLTRVPGGAPTEQPAPATRL